MSAADPLVAAGVSLQDVGGALGGLDPGRVSIRLAPGWMRALWRRDIAAMATPWAIFVRSWPLPYGAGEVAGLVVHELAHVAQWRRLGIFRFLRRYLGDYLRGRLRGWDHDRAYRAISLEQEAERTRRLVVT